MVSRFRKIDERRSYCPISSILDVIGDKWSLLIIRDMILFGKSSYNEFLGSAEKIATNILSERLAMLTKTGFITYTGPEKRKKYLPTQKAIELKNVLEAMGKYGAKHFNGSKQYMEKQIKNLEVKKH